jgi:hypothetical protein
MVKNLVPTLPDGVRIVDKTADLELLQRSKSKWNVYVETLKVIDSTKVIQMDVKSFSKNRITGVKQGIRGAAKTLGFKHIIKFCQDNGTLNIWSNR